MATTLIATFDERPYHKLYKQDNLQSTTLPLVSAFKPLGTYCLGLNLLTQHHQSPPSTHACETLYRACVMFRYYHCITKIADRDKYDTCTCNSNHGSVYSDTTIISCNPTRFIHKQWGVGFLETVAALCDSSTT